MSTCYKIKFKSLKFWREIWTGPEPEPAQDGHVVCGGRVENPLLLPLLSQLGPRKEGTIEREKYFLSRVTFYARINQQDDRMIGNK